MSELFSDNADGFGFMGLLFCQLAEFKELAMVACILYCCFLGFLVYRQCTYDIFFIDWEKPRWSFSTSGSGKDYYPISTWRTLFVCNEWNELQTSRLSSLEVTLMFMVRGFIRWGVAAVEQIEQRIRKI